MTDEQQKVILELRDEGYAIAIFTPEELQGADIDSVEDGMIAVGWEVIEMTKETDDIEEE